MIGLPNKHPGDLFVSAGLQFLECESDRLDGVMGEFLNEVRQQHEGALAQDAEQPVDGEDVSLGDRDQRAFISAVPSQASRAAADFAEGGLWDFIFLDESAIGHDPLLDRHTILFGQNVADARAGGCA